MVAAHRLLALVAVVAMVGAGCADDGATSAPAATGPTATAPGTATTPGTARASDTATTPAGEPVVVFDRVPPLHPSVDDWDAGTVEVVAGDGEVHHVAVRLATTPEQRRHGLMEVPDLPDGVGMWFVFGQDRTGGFWMKNTVVPLDITYVGADDRIVSIAHAAPCERDPCPVHDPADSYRHVLEVPGGYLDRIGAGVGDVVRLVDPGRASAG